MPTVSFNPGFGTVKSGKGPAVICSNVPKYVAYAAIAACPDGTCLWKPVAGATSATVTIPSSQNCPNAWIAFKLIGAPTPRPCAAMGTITFPIPPGTSNILFTVYFPTKPAPSSVSIVWNPAEIEPDCS